jgi:hypothetical protein
MTLWKWTAAAVLALLTAVPSYADWPRHHWGPEQHPEHGRWYNPPRWNNQYQPPPPPQWNYPNPPPVAAYDGRSVWVYGSQNEGSWRALGNGQWVETNPTGQWYYVETARGRDFIDLLDQNRHIAVRLTNGQMYSRAEVDPNWGAPGYSGRWVQ